MWLVWIIKVEPYWNVNDEIIIEDEYINKIKVEPYWNVNPFKASL